MYEMPDGSPGQAVWVDIPDAIHHALGVGNAFLNANAFRSEFSIDVDEDAETLPGENPPFIPSDEGLQHKLPDGVVVSIRMSLRAGG